MLAELEGPVAGLRLVDIATPDPVTVEPGASLKEALSVMHAKGLRDVVVEKGMENMPF
jgi:CBS domain-containing protein